MLRIRRSCAALNGACTRMSGQIPTVALHHFRVATGRIWERSGHLTLLTNTETSTGIVPLCDRIAALSMSRFKSATVIFGTHQLMSMGLSGLRMCRQCDLLPTGSEFGIDPVQHTLMGSTYDIHCECAAIELRTRSEYRVRNIKSDLLFPSIICNKVGNAAHMH